MNAFDTVSYMNETMNAHNFLQKRLHSVYSNCREEIKSVDTIRQFDVFRISAKMIQVLEIIQKENVYYNLLQALGIIQKENVDALRDILQRSIVCLKDIKDSMKSNMQKTLRKILMFDDGNMLPDLIVLKILDYIIKAGDAEDGDVQFEENYEQFREILCKFYQDLQIVIWKIGFLNPGQFFHEVDTILRSLLEIMMEFKTTMRITDYRDDVYQEKEEEDAGREMEEGENGEVKRKTYARRGG